MSVTNLNKNILRLFTVLNSPGSIESKVQDFRYLDWPALVSKINEAGLAGYFADVLSAPEMSGVIHKEALVKLTNAARRIAAHNAFYEDQASKILTGLSALGVECLLLKGFSYMAEIYGNNSARRMSDIDLLIHLADRFRVRDYLLSESFIPYIEPTFRGSADEFILVADFAREAHYTKKTGVLALHIDLHWKMQANFEGHPMNDALALDTLPWWYSTSHVAIGKATALRLSPEMQLIHMAIHFALHHQFNGMRWFIELCLFIHKFGNVIKPESISAIVRSPDCRKVLGITLRMTEEALGYSFENRLNWRGFMPKGALLPGEYSFYKKCLMRNYRSKIATYLCMLLAPSTMAGRWRMVKYFLFDPHSVMFWWVSGKSGSKWLQPFYIFYRLIREALRRRHA